MKGGKD